jgi:Tfp pilus assembly protein PilN
MKKVRIDFAPPSLGRALFRGPRPGLSLLIATLALAPLLASNVTQYRRLLQEQDAAQAQVASARAQAVVRAPLPTRTRVPEAQAGAVNAAVLQLNLPWRALHDVVQSSTPASIALLALEPDAKRHNLRITAEARSSDDMLAYVRQLGQQDWFSAVALARHEINEQDPNRPIRFQVDAEWKAAP